MVWFLYDNGLRHERVKFKCYELQKEGFVVKKLKGNLI